MHVLGLKHRGTAGYDHLYLHHVAANFAEYMESIKPNELFSLTYTFQNLQINLFNNKMKGQSEIAYLPKFANIMLIVMVIVINEIF